MERIIAQSRSRYAGKLYMVASAFCTATGQLFWKWGLEHVAYLAAGFLLYGIGALLMMRSLSMEKLSIAYPILSLGYPIALLYGSLFLHETISLQKIAAVLIIMLGVALIAYEK